MTALTCKVNIPFAIFLGAALFVAPPAKAATNCTILDFSKTHHLDVSIDPPGTNVGDRVNITCRYGYEFQFASPNSFVCTDAGEWDPDSSDIESIRCVRVACEKLNQTIPNAKFDYGGGHDFQDEAAITCTKGFFFDPSLSQTSAKSMCLGNKTWSVNVADGCQYTAPTATLPKSTTPVNVETTSTPKIGSTADIPPSSSRTEQPTAPVTDGTPAPSSSRTEQPTAPATDGTPAPTGGTSSTEAGDNTTQEGGQTSQGTEGHTTPNITDNPTYNGTTEAAGNSTGGFDNQPKDRSGTYYGIGVGCTLLLIVLVSLALYFLRVSKSSTKRKYANFTETIPDEPRRDSFENRLFDLDSVDIRGRVELGENERAVDVEQD